MALGSHGLWCFLLWFGGLWMGYDERENEGIEEDRDDRACKYQVSAFRRQHAELRSSRSKNERKFNDLREARRDRQRSLARITKCPDDKEGRDRLAENADRHRCQKRKRLLDDHRRIEQHAD